MVAFLGPAALMVLFGVQWALLAAAGGNNLKSPHNVEVSIIDDSFILKWNRSNESVKNVTFSADYQISGMDNWIKLPGCQYITSTKCSFSSANLKVYQEIKLRVRAEKGNSTSPWYEVDPFIPFLKAQIGPPEVHLEAEDKAIVITISSPGTEDSVMWAMDKSKFIYSLVFWKNSSGVEKRIEPVYSRDKIYKLSPETTYCLKVKARLRLQRKVGLYSPVYCINTTVENKLPPPENVEVDVENQNYVLKWDYSYENTTFQVQWLQAYFKKFFWNRSNKWKQIPECKNTKTTQCIFPRDIFPKGIYFLRVQASNGNNTSLWSEEKKFDTDKLAVVLPPVINVKSINSSLHIYLSGPKESENTSVNQYYPTIYEIVFWENTSTAESKMLESKTDFTLPNLQPLTVYCVKARALVEFEKWNKSSVFSDTVCEKTKQGNTSIIWIIIGICVTFFSSPFVIYAVKSLLKCIKYVFFPSCTPPSSIDEYLSENPLKNLLLFTSEEQTERCFIIENTSTIDAEEETPQIDEDHKKYNSQTSRDSGNYSNEDENSEDKTSEQLLL